jgi:phage terminase large subunit-like protein
MSEPTPPELPDSLADYRNWKPEAQQRALDLLKEAKGSGWRPFYCPNAGCDGNPHDKWDWQHARVDQRPPKWTDDWLVWLLKGGRGSGKTRTGAETTHRVTKAVPRLILIAPTGYDLRETMVEGVSGILATAPPGQRPLWEPSKKKLTWPNGCIGQGFSAEEPDRLRGPQSGFIWGDEPAHWPLVDECWSNMLFGLRMGKHPKVIATSTPKPTKWMRELIAHDRTIVHSVSTYANLVNLSPLFRDTVIDRYEGTRLGRQELHGEVLEDVEGALWQWEMIEWIDEAPDLVRIVVAVDPAGTANAKSDETGIIVLGIGADKVIYVLADYSGKYSPGGWAKRVWAAVDEFSADAVVAEKNYGGDMVKHTLETHAPQVAARVKMVTSRRGKALRAEPIVALYEKHRVKHVGKRGDLSTLEEEQTSWVPGEGASPNRVDALVHGATDLAKISAPTTVADPNKLLRRDRHLRAV